MNFSAQLKKYRTKRGLSQDELARKLFISRQAISKWENGEGTPDLSNLVKLAGLLNVSLDTLVLGVEETPSKIDSSQFVYEPTTGLYVRRLGQMNVWDFLAQFWWLIFFVAAFVYGFIYMMKL
jgi:transcriptional regulator with XRE-family HTH domain